MHRPLFNSGLLADGDEREYIDIQAAYARKFEKQPEKDYAMIGNACAAKLIN